MKRLFLTLIAIFGLLTTNAQSRQQITADLMARQTNCDYAKRAVQMTKNAETKAALEFLYAYMSWPDMTDYSPEYYVAQTECAVRARHEMAWGKQVPEREWLHFVLPIRINNENLDEFRTTVYDELKARVAGKSMYEAVFEVNHWCHEKVTYKPSDIRTSSPLASMRTAYGRCGEESTFTVSALRAVGIPARQVYTPRWAHTDDNHAWVEAWVDGKWYFLGACEPEPVLNLGWFNQPASRGMLMHTKVYGRYDGPEDIISKTNCYTEINITDNYAHTTRSYVEVVDEKGKPVPGALVEFKLYNYGEFFTVYRTYADEKGRCNIQTGEGDCIVWASKDGVYGIDKFKAGTRDFKVKINHRAGDRFAFDLNLVPPPGHDNIPPVSPEAAAANEILKAREDSIRTAYIHTFPTKEAFAKDCQAWGYDVEKAWPFMEMARGNHAALSRLLREYMDKGESVLKILGSMSQKDIRDFDFEVVADHFDAAHLPKKITDFEARYVYNPRIINEMLAPWRSTMFKHTEFHQLRKDPAKIAAWIRNNISTDDDWNPVNLCQNPENALKYRHADLRNKGILFVAIARSLRIPARIDEVTGKVQYCQGEGQEWKTVELNDKATAAASDAAGTLTLGYTPRESLENPGYYSHFTLARITEGVARLQEYSEGNSSWQQDFKDGARIDAGDYALVSGTRMADGSVLAHVEVFPITAGQKLNVPLVMREDNTGVQVIGNFNAENLYYDLDTKSERGLIATTGRGYYVLGMLRANHEPSNHILHDISLLRQDLEAWGRPILMLFPSQDEYDRFLKNSSEYKNLPSTLHFGIDTKGEVCKDLFGSGLTKSEELPLVVIADTFNRVVFKSQGYTIGLGEQIKQTVAKIK